jgi:hypothetical protein
VLHLRVQEFPHHGQQVVNGHQQRLPQVNRHRLLRPRRGRLQAVEACGCYHERCRFASICRRSARAPRTASPRLTQVPRSPGSPAALSACSSAGCEDGQQARTPLQMPLRTYLAMKNAERRGSMGSSEMEHLVLYGCFLNGSSWKLPIADSKARIFRKPTPLPVACRTPNPQKKVFLGLYR